MTKPLAEPTCLDSQLTVELRRKILNVKIIAFSPRATSYVLMKVFLVILLSTQPRLCRIVVRFLPEPLTTQRTDGDPE